MKSVDRICLSSGPSDVDVLNGFIEEIVASWRITYSQRNADQTELEELSIPLAWIPQCHPSPKTSNVKVCDDGGGNQAIHDEGGDCCENMFLPSQFAGENRHDELAHQPLNAPNASLQT